MIELKNVTRSYELGGEKIDALNSVSLKIEKGDFIAIVGPSGSGKSTLANVIGGLDKPTAGEVLIDGRDLSRSNDKELSLYRNQTIGFVFQSFNLQPHYTAWENVAVPLLFSRVPGKQRKERAQEMLKLVGLGDRINHRPAQLSGGQRQRVAIARALITQPQAVIADEPTGNLDSHHGEEIVALLKKLNKELGTTLIIITHDQSLARQAGRIITIRDGKLS